MPKEKSMTKFLSQLLSLLILTVGITLAGCNTGDKKQNVAAPKTTTPKPVKEAAKASDEGGIVVNNAFYYNHINSLADEEKTIAFVLFEYEQPETIKYQVAYVACTCRGESVNYYSVAYVELSKKDGSVAVFSCDKDSSGHYTAGLYGDSTETADGTPVKEPFKAFVKDFIIGASQKEINAIQPMHGDVDVYSGATVTPNNLVRMLQGLFKYHNKKYAHKN